MEFRYTRCKRERTLSFSFLAAQFVLVRSAVFSPSTHSATHRHMPCSTSVCCCPWSVFGFCVRKPFSSTTFILVHNSMSLRAVNRPYCFAFNTSPPPHKASVAVYSISCIFAILIISAGFACSSASISAFPDCLPPSQHWLYVYTE